MRFGRFEENIDAVKVLFVIFAVACALELTACAYCVDISDRLFFYALVAYTLILPFIIGFAALRLMRGRLKTETPVEILQSLMKRE